MITCKKATYLLSKKEEGKLFFTEKIQLNLHLLMCSLCRLFEQQSLFIGKNAGHQHEHHQEKLSEVSKEKIIQLLKDNAG
jgi:predicted metal-dependent hydrolase